MVAPEYSRDYAPPCDWPEVMAVLEAVPDPEIPVVSIVDLGIVREVTRNPAAVAITPTYSGCPATAEIERSVRSALDEAGFREVSVRTVLAPPWTTDWITDRGRDRLLAYGIAPPERGSGEASLLPSAAACPRCGSTDTNEVSRFGSTPCKALWRCLSCLEPFDRFKCH
jgi:ring-1,2-phenylacetyl-CoA epoxidase subunit PaaD